MNLLAIDCATKVAAIGLARGPGTVVELTVQALNHAPTLMGAIDEAIRKSGIELADLQGVAVGVGPGSFTGLRIGVATAKGIAFALSVPVWGVSTLRAMSMGLGGANEADETIVPVVDARKGEVYAAAYRGGAELMVPTLFSTADFYAWLATQNGAIIRVGVGTPHLGPTAAQIAGLAFARAANLPAGDGDALAPAYVSPVRIRSAQPPIPTT